MRKNDFGIYIFDLGKYSKVDEYKIMEPLNYIFILISNEWMKIAPFSLVTDPYVRIIIIIFFFVFLSKRNTIFSSAFIPIHYSYKGNNNIWIYNVMKYHIHPTLIFFWVFLSSIIEWMYFQMDFLFFYVGTLKIFPIYGNDLFRRPMRSFICTYLYFYYQIQ